MKATHTISKTFILWLFLAQLISLNAEEKSSLPTQFANPPDEYRSGVKWEWCNGMINRLGITGDLEAMKRAGLGRGKFFNAGGIEGPVSLITLSEDSDPLIQQITRRLFTYSRNLRDSPVEEDAQKSPKRKRRKQ